MTEKRVSLMDIGAIITARIWTYGALQILLGQMHKYLLNCHQLQRRTIWVNITLSPFEKQTNNCTMLQYAAYFYHLNGKKAQWPLDLMLVEANNNRMHSIINIGKEQGAMMMMGRSKWQ